MKLSTTWGRAAEAAGGTLLAGDPGAALESLSTDTRTLAPGSAFWALRGARFDAHDFLKDPGALKAGGWVVRRGAPLPAARPPFVLAVDDTLEALGRLAAFHRSRFDLPVAGITGTNGKTTVKEMLRAVLARSGPVCATTGNFNNEIGLPLSVLALEAGHRSAVFEMGASRRGDIKLLAGIARPTVGVLTNIGPAHLEYFGDVETVFKTKRELIDALPEGAPVVLNADDERLASLARALGARAVWFSTRDPRARVRVLRPPEAPASGITLQIDGTTVRVPGSEFGPVHRINAAAAAAAAAVLGIAPEETAAGLAQFRPAPLRFAERRHPSGARLVVDTYNANPASMKAGVETFIETAGDCKRFVVLGDMRELGPGSRALHAEVGGWLAAAPIDGAFLVGPDMEAAASELRRRGHSFPVLNASSPAAVVDGIKSVLGPDSAVYFKASRAMRLEEIIEAL